jgi:membrane dipeptidase
MPAPLIDNLQNGNWSPDIFAQLREGGADAVQVTIACHETFREIVLNLERWNRWFEEHPELIFKGTRGDDVRLAQKSGRTAVFFGFQSPRPIEDDIGLVEICYQFDIRFLQLTYNDRSLLATGCYEEEDTRLTRMGRQVVEEMNRVGIVVDMSHSSDRSHLRGRRADLPPERDHRCQPE